MRRTRDRILLVPIGPIEPEILAAIAAPLAETFHLKVAVAGEIPLPAASLTPGRRQLNSFRILETLRGKRPDRRTSLLGVCGADLYARELNFVFGEAMMGGGVAVISLARLHQEFYGLHPDRGLLLARAVKEAVHELGHLSGLGHCPTPCCVMHFSNTLADTDRKGPGFCETCRKFAGSGFQDDKMVDRYNVKKR